MRPTLLVGCAVALLAATACSAAPSEPVAGGPPTTTPSADPTRQEVVRTRHPIEPIDLTDLWVRRRGDRVWVADERPPRPAGSGRHTGCRRVTSDLDLCTTADVSPAIRWTRDGGATWTRVPAPVHGVLTGFVPSLVPGRMVLALGGDGATLFPLLRVLSSTDDGTNWTTYEVPEVDGERRYTRGEVLLSNGRLLVLVEAWSDDTLERHSARHHGFFVSTVDNLGDLSPVEPRFVPPLGTPSDHVCCISLDASSDPDPVLWTTTPDRRLYYSVDDARTFRELPVSRP